MADGSRANDAGDAAIIIPHGERLVAPSLRRRRLRNSIIGNLSFDDEQQTETHDNTATQMLNLEIQLLSYDHEL